MKAAQAKTESSIPAPAVADTTPAGSAIPPAKPYDGPKAKQGTTRIKDAPTVSPDVDAGTVTFGTKTTIDEHGTSQDPTKPDKQASSEQTATISADGVGLKHEATATDGDKRSTRAGGVEITGDGVKLESADTVTTGTGDEEKTTGRKKSVKVGKDGVAISNQAAGDGLGGSAKVGPDGASGEVTYKDGAATIDVGGGITLKVVGPTETDEAYTVAVSRISSVNIKGGGDKEESHGGAISVLASGTSTITRTFAHDAEGKKQAMEFAASKAKLTALFARDVVTAKDAISAMTVGETRADGVSVGAGATGSVTAGVVSATAGISGEAGSGSAIKRVTKDVFEVTRSSSTSSTKEAGLAGTGAGVSGSSTHSAEHDETWKFDLGDPVQAREFEAYVKNGATPKHAKRKTASDSKSDGGKTGIETPIMSVSTGGSVTETDSVDESGKKWKEIIGEHTLAWTSKITDDKHASSEEFRAVVDQETGEAAYGINAKAGGTDGAANQEELGKATGTGLTGRDGVDASGDWTVTTYFTQGEIEAIVNGVLHNKNAAGGLPSTADAAATLQRAFSKAKDTAAYARAIAGYVKTTGPKGLAALRSMAGIDTATGRDEVALAPKDGGRSPFLGPKGRTEYQDKIARYQHRIASPEDSVPIAQDMGKDLLDLDWRLTELRHEKYPDLPAALLIEERHKVESFATVLESLRAAAMATTPAQDAVSADRLDGRARSQLAVLGEAAASCGAQSTRAQKTFSSCRGRYFQHIESAQSSTRSMRGQYPGEYEKVDASYQVAVSTLEGSDAIARHLEGQSVALAGQIASGVATAKIAEAAASIATTTDNLARVYQHAADEFVNVCAALDKIWRSHADEFKTPVAIPEGI